MTTLVAMDPGEPLVQVTAVEKTLQGLVLDPAVDVPGLAQLLGMLRTFGLVFLLPGSVPIKGNPFNL